ncbi:MAG: hypothetical protein A3B31_01050 [Candidatus Komeilibacteria bacterium RIFCSPLOWO2_01_FULL_53_11]|uniref:Uncharacterized protein n=1 Tax=Candidatus Komeilibacteria bacterium RIFCSPLOWO2_01_FULL_53_11 TaxID=1798552 RepID=A0A1G2BS11_9BACT|nr:MAG: hypothetical protein A3B31_01050 [Candidatus Komeilibacteria bacterium RIFCSPLOWO2_01_FULL_53_11]
MFALSQLPSMKKRLQWYELSLTALAVVMLSAVFIPHEIMCVVVVLGAASLLVVMASLARKQRLRITEWSDFARPILNNPADI